MSKEKSEIGGNAIIYSYPCGDYDVICSNNQWFMPPGWEKAEDFSHPGRADGIGTEKKRREVGKKSQGDDMSRSMRRARAKVRRLALANDFKWFVTLTLSPDEVDRYDAAAIMKRVNRWLSNMVQRHGLSYILVPERHKDGAFHFHGFFSDDKYSFDALPSGHYDKQGHEIYNLPQWPFGFTAAIRLYGTYSQAVAYVTKYIGKQDGERPMGRWYYSGGDLKEPQKDYVIADYTDVMQNHEGEAVELEIPGAKLLVVHHHKI